MRFDLSGLRKLCGALLALTVGIVLLMGAAVPCAVAATAPGAMAMAMQAGGDPRHHDPAGAECALACPLAQAVAPSSATGDTPLLRTEAITFAEPVTRPGGVDRGPRAPPPR